MKRAGLSFFFCLFLAPLGLQAITLDEYFEEAEKAGYTEREALTYFDDLWEGEDAQVWVEIDREEYDLETLIFDPAKAGKRSKRKGNLKQRRSKKSPGSWKKSSKPSNKLSKRKKKRRQFQIQKPTQASRTRSKTRR